MGLVKIKFEVLNEVQFSRAFGDAANKVNDLTLPFSLLANDFFTTMANVFEAEGAFEEREKWQELSPTYAAWKARHYPGKKILERTGRMLRSLTIRGSEDNILKIEPMELQIGTRVPYAIYHQTGTPRLPMRKIIELTGEQKKRWVQIVHKYIWSIYHQTAEQTRRYG